MPGGVRTDPAEAEKILADAGLDADMGAVLARARDLLIRHGIFGHSRGGLRISGGFCSEWASGVGREGTLRGGLRAAVIARAPGLGPDAVASMCLEAGRLLAGSRAGEALAAERREAAAEAGVTVTHGALAGVVGRARRSVEAEGL